MPPLASLFGFVPFIKYPLIILAAIFEGPIIMMLSGVFIRLNMLDLVPAYFALMAGDLIGDICWYWIGRRWGQPFIQRFGKYMSITEEHVTTVKRFFHQYHNKILIISKLTTGFGFAPVVLFTAGFTSIPFRRYVLINAIGELFWTGALIGIGFFFTDLYVRVNNLLGRMVIFSGIVIIAIILFGLGKYIRSRIIKNYGKE